MKFLIRFITRNAAGGVEHNDKIVDAPAITIGRATDQVLHLRDRRARLQHAQIEPQDGGVHVTTSALSGVEVNGHSQRDARLSTGDVIEVGSNVLRVIDPPANVDFAISFELLTEASSEHMAASWSAPATGLAGWTKRRLSWTLVAAVLVLAFALPALSVFSPTVATLMRGSAFLPDDGMWMAGPVHSAHSSLADNCESCHTKVFQRVPDSACQSCHLVDRHVNDPEQAVLGDARCATCHLEHNEPPQLVKRHQGLCADCHGDLADDVALENAEDFLDAHPQFKVSLLRPAMTATEVTWNLEHFLLADAKGADQSNLKFNHRAHLDTEGIVTPEGRRVIKCVDCHKPEPGGARMQAIKMDENCAGCHTLSFDPDDPSRQVPHGKPAAVMQALVEYYSARLLGADPDAVEQRVRRPGQALTRQDRDRAAAEARVQAMKVAEDLFERQSCVTCHEVTRVEDNAALPWRVLPVRLTNSFYPHANFTHAAHDTEVSDCDSCHKASASESATDLLIPDIDTCRECHGSGSARRNNAAQTPSTCIMCHSFHFPAKGQYQDKAAGATGAAW